MTLPPLPTDDMQTLAVASLFSVWLGLTVLNSTSTWYTKLRRLGPLHDVIPKWNFFAPKPGTHDYHLFYRDRFVDGNVGYWREAPGLGEPRPWYTPVWNPNKFVPKALFDLVQDLMMQAATVAGPGPDDPDADGGRRTEETQRTGDVPQRTRSIHRQAGDLSERNQDEHRSLSPMAAQSLQLTMPYIVLLSYVSKVPRSSLSIETQFAVIQLSAYEETTEPVFVSGFHKLES